MFEEYIKNLINEKRPGFRRSTQILTMLSNCMNQKLRQY